MTEAERVIAVRKPASGGATMPGPAGIPASTSTPSSR
jgi:hypothetical protein